jgi:hypothetical protein
MTAQEREDQRRSGKTIINSALPLYDDREDLSGAIVASEESHS